MEFLAIDEYGLRCLLQLARVSPNGVVTTTQIARAEGLRTESVARVISKLRAGGLIRSTRGESEAHRLSRPAREITAWEAIRVLGAEFFPTGSCDCHPSARRECGHAEERTATALWSKVEAALREGLDELSLDDLLHGKAFIGEEGLDTRAGPGPTRPVDTYRGDE